VRREVALRLADILIKATRGEEVGALRAQGKELRRFVFDNGHLEVTAVFAWHDTNVVPWRLYTWYPDPREPSSYVEYEPIEGGEKRCIIAHNFYAYREEMRYWGMSIIEAIIVNELHELTHWAMERDERLRWRLRDGLRGIHHSEYWNPLLLRIVRETRG